MRIQIKREPECSGIEDASTMSCEDYGRLMWSRLAGEYRRFAEQALAHDAPPEGGTVIEIGPGPGWAGLMILERRPDLRLLGLDASQDMVRAATANAASLGFADRASYRVGKAERLELVAQGSADLVVSRDSLHHWENPVQAFSSIAGALKSSGALYLADERRDLSPWAWAFVYGFGMATMGGFSRYWRSSIRSSYTAAELSAMLPELEGRAWSVELGFLDLKLRLRPCAARA